MKAQRSGGKRKWIIIGTLAAFVLGLGGIAGGVVRSHHFRHHDVLFDPALVESLNLESEQQAALEDLRRRVEADRGNGWKEMQGVKAIFEEERDSDEPNLRRVIAAMKDRARTVWSDKEAMLEDGLQLYDTLSTEQKRVVVAALGERIDRFEGMRGHGGSHHGGKAFDGRHGARTGAGHGPVAEGIDEFHLGRMGERLNLSDAQRDAVEAIIESQRPQLAEGVAKLQANRARLHGPIGQDRYDQATVRAVAEERGQVVADLTVIRTQMRSEIRAQLDGEQRKALDEMFEHRYRGRDAL